VSLLLQGLSEKLVASRLKVSRQTVHTHVKDIDRVLDVHSRAELLPLFFSATVEEPRPGDYH
jgi:DNA-binding CsgD family transcriptional regulator